ncbi:MAG: LptF/LptG family permease [Nitrospirota bacterium]
MKRLQKLYIKEFFVALIITGFGLSIIFSLINLIDKLDDFIKGNPPVGDLFLYAALNIPKNLLYLLPIATLICSLFVFTNAIKKNEIVIIKAAGGRIKRLIMPFILTGFILSIFAFVLSEIIMPLTLEQAERLKATLSSPKEQGVSMTLKSQSSYRPSLIEGTLWLKDKKGSVVRLGLYSYEGLYADDIRIFIFDKRGLSEHLIAEKAFWDGKTWVLANAKRYILKNGIITQIEELPYPNLESPNYFKERLKKTEEMRIGELYRYIKKLNRSGYRNPKLVVDFNSRLSYPLINLFMLILGISLPLRSGITKGIVVSGIGLVAVLVYWGGYVLSLSLGNAGIIPPSLAPWSMPALFGIISVVLFKKIPE